MRNGFDIILVDANHNIFVQALKISSFSPRHITREQSRALGRVFTDDECTRFVLMDYGLTTAIWWFADENEFKAHEAWKFLMRHL